MKNMGYIVISIAAVMIAVLIFAGCSIQPENNANKDFTGISFSCNHMNYRYCYSFYLRQEGDLVLFDAQVHFDEEPHSIILEGCRVDNAYFDELKSLDEKLGIVHHVNSYKKKYSPFHADDATVETTTVYFADGTDKSADSGEYAEELLEFFSELAMTYASESVIKMTG